MLARRRFRLQAAGLASLALISFLIFVLFPPRKVRIVADGDNITVSSTTRSDATLVKQAGIELQPGDTVEAASDDSLMVQRATEAVVEVDGEGFTLRTQAEAIDAALAEAEVVLQPQDSVLRNGSFVSPGEPVAPPESLAAVLGGASSAPGTPGAGPVTLEVRRAVPFTVFEDGQQLQLRSSRETVATALRTVGVRLGPGDRVQPPPNTELSAGLTVRVEHAVQVVVTMPEGKLVLYSLASTVGEALRDGGVPLPPQYRLEPAAETPLVPGLAIHVVGVSEQQELEQERIESRTLYRPDPSLPWGERRVVQGRDGVRFRQYRAVYEDGRLTAREMTGEWYDPEPADTVVYYSTARAPARAAPRPAAVQAPEGMNVVRVLRVYATWYNAASAGRSPSDPSYGITATGVRVDRGVVAVDPSIIPLGSRMFIPGYGNGVAADTGGGIRGNMIDLGYPDGVVPDWVPRWVDIYILGP